MTLQELPPRRRSWFLLTVAGALVTVYWAIWVVIGSEQMLKMLDLIMVPVSVAVVYTYAPSVFRGLSQNGISPVDCIRLGIILAWGATGLDRLWRFFWREAGYPEGLATHWVPAFLLYVIVVAGFLHSIALGLDINRSAAVDTAWKLTLRAIAVAVLVVIMYIFMERFDGTAKEVLTRLLGGYTYSPWHSR